MIQDASLSELESLKLGQQTIEIADRNNLSETDFVTIPLVVLRNLVERSRRPHD